MFLIRLVKRLLDKKREPFRVDEVRILERLGKNRFRTGAFYKGEPVGREVVLITSNPDHAYFNHP